jgi:hypothetical protein
LIIAFALIAAHQNLKNLIDYPDEKLRPPTRTVNKNNNNIIVHGVLHCTGHTASYYSTVYKREFPSSNFSRVVVKSYALSFSCAGMHGQKIISEIQ